MGLALDGLRYAFKSQRSLRIEIVVAGGVVVAGFSLEISRLEWAVVVVSIFAVISLELVNTAVEAVVDLVSPTYHPVAKIAKDIAAAAVLAMAVGGAIVGAIIFGT